MEVPGKRRCREWRAWLLRHRHGAKRPRSAAALGLAVFILELPGVQTARTAVTLPIEIVGESGTTSRVSVDVPAGRARDVRSLWMQIHGLTYPDMVSVNVNESAWFSLNNDTVTVADPGKAYGGIGGGVSTLKVTLALPPDTVVEGANTIQLRFNRSDGVASGVRVVAFNFLTGDGVKVVEPDAFTQEDPATW